MNKLDILHQERMSRFDTLKAKELALDFIDREIFEIELLHGPSCEVGRLERRAKSLMDEILSYRFAVVSASRAVEIHSEGSR